MATVRRENVREERYQPDKAFYDNIRAAKPQYKRVSKFVISPYSGRGFIVKKGHTFRVIQEAGPQAATMAFWNAHNPKEYYNAMRKRVREGLFIRLYTRMWSDVPRFRPMMTCVEDTVVTQPPDSDFHHHRFWTHCSSQVMEMRSGRAGLNSCHTNLRQAIEPFGWKDEEIRYNLSLFQKVRLDPNDGKLYGARSDAKAGDYIESGLPRSN